MIVSSPYPLSLVLDERTARFVEKDMRDTVLSYVRRMTSQR